MSEVFDFFSPLIEKDAHSNNFNFICTEPNFSCISSKPFQVEPLLKTLNQDLNKFSNLLEYIFSYLASELHVPQPLSQ
jgi:hypothetical protein